MKRVYYLGFYDIEQNKSENRNYVLSATNKMRYIIDTIETCGQIRYNIFRKLKKDRAKV